MITCTHTERGSGRWREGPDRQTDTHTHTLFALLYLVIDSIQKTWNGGKNGWTKLLNVTHQFLHISSIEPHPAATHEHEELQGEGQEEEEEEEEGAERGKRERPCWLNERSQVEVLRSYLHFSLKHVSQGKV